MRTLSGLIRNRLQCRAFGEMSNCKRRSSARGCARKLQRLIDGFAGNALIGTVQHVIITEDDGIGRFRARVQRLPNVPMQQTFAPRSLAFPPDVPTFTGGVCANCSSLGKTWEGVGVGVGKTVLEPPPPHPTAPISTITPNNNPEILPIGIRL